VRRELHLELQCLASGSADGLTLDSGAVAEAIKSKFSGHVYSVGQKAAINFALSETRNIPLSFKVTKIEFMERLDSPGGGSEGLERSASSGAGGPASGGGGGGGAAGSGGGRFAQLLSSTEVVLARADKETFKLSGGSGSRRPQLFSKGFNFAELGIGGLDDEFQLIFRQAFASRLLPPAVVSAMGMSHVRGMLLFGPPGCGKTLIARQIGQALRAHEPKVVNGPEVLNKYVGQSEENIRNLFADAEKEQAERGDESDLHIIIFDEIDAICRKRGTVGGGTGVHDSIVNQLLSKIDGVEALNNVLIIGMTNRKDMLDEALIRPGRLEVHVEIGLPDEPGRLQIIKIHTEKLRKGGYLSPDVDLEDVALRTKNFTGAELARVVRNARSFAIARIVDPKDLTKKINPKDIVITHMDFVRAAEETEPKFGVKEGTLVTLYPNGIVDFGPEFHAVEATLKRLVRQTATSRTTPMLSVCLCGPSGAGKSALSASIATQSGFPFIKRLGPEDMLAMQEGGKATLLSEYFDDAYRSPLSVLVLDDIERMMDYVPIGPRFSNAVLQALLVLLRRPPPTDGKRLLVIATTSEESILEDMGLLGAFTSVQRLPVLSSPDHFRSILDACATDCMVSPDERAAAAARLAERPAGMTVKRLFTLVDMARHSNDDIEGAIAGAPAAPPVVTADDLILCAMESGVHS
jgi:vesicle-fusing ATPase